MTLPRYRELFGENKHPFTGVDYVEYYSGLIREAGADVEIIFAGLRHRNHIPVTYFKAFRRSRFQYTVCNNLYQIITLPDDRATDSS